MRPQPERGSRELHCAGHHTSVQWTEQELTLTIRSGPTPGSARHAHEQLLAAATGRRSPRQQVDGPLRLRRDARADMERAGQVLRRTGVLMASPRGDRQLLAWLISAGLSPEQRRAVCPALEREISELNAAQMKAEQMGTPAHTSAQAETSSTETSSARTRTGGTP